ncbi:MAG: cytochrome c maturation protein CcmE [candidate division NC10 bacterium]|nr:cytochrome c maturation protein CcmE [candidate division NC10 bacterium]
MSMKKKRTKFIIAPAVVLVALGYLVYAGMRDAMLYYLTVSELKEKVPSIYGQGVRLGGRVVEGSIKWDPIALKLEFIIADEKENTLPVAYKGVVPDTFKGGVDVVVEGKYSPQGVFIANILLAKCPSKYEAKT